MECQIKELLPEFALGEASTTNTSTIEAHLGSCPECREELASLQQAFVSLVDALPRVQPSQTTQAQLFSQVDGVRRFDPFIDRVASLFDLQASSSEGLLRSLDQEELWQPGPRDGVSVLLVDAGPRLASAQTLLVRIQPQVRFPRHKHINGEEHVLLLQGAYQDESGEIVKRGQLVQLPNHHTHDLVALGGPVCIGAVVHYGHEYFDL